MHIAMKSKKLLLWVTLLIPALLTVYCEGRGKDMPEAEFCQGDRWDIYRKGGVSGMKCENMSINL